MGPIILALFSLIFGVLISINGAFTLSRLAQASYITASVSLFLEMTMFAFAEDITYYWAFAAFTHLFYQVFTVAPLIHIIHKGYTKSKGIADIASLVLLAMVLGSLFSCVGSLFIVDFVARDRVDYWVANVVSVYDLLAPICYILVSVIQIHKLWPVGKFYPDIRRRIIIQGVVAATELLVLIVFNILLRYDPAETLIVFVAVDLLMLWDSTIMAVVVRDIIELANNSVKEFKSADGASHAVTRGEAGSSNSKGSHSQEGTNSFVASTEKKSLDLNV